MFIIFSKLILIFLFSISMFMVAPSVESQEIKLKPSEIKIKVRVYGDDDLKSLFQSNILRELREFNDVVIVDHKSDYELIFVVTYPSKEDRTFFAISRVQLENMHTDIFDSIMEETGVKPEVNSFLGAKISIFRNQLARLYIFRHHYLSFALMDSLKKECSLIVAEFNTKTLEDHRKTVREINKMREERIENEEKLKELKKEIKDYNKQ